jgi:hypothetical protein
VLDQITEDLAARGLSHHSSWWYLQANVFATGARFVRAASVLGAPRPYLAPVVKMEERIEALLDNQDHVASTAPVATVWSAARHELLAPKGNATVAAVASAHCDPY